jgi:uncharacterized membrane protein
VAPAPPAAGAAPALPLNARSAIWAPRPARVAALVWLAFFWTAGIARYAVFQSGRFDLGNMTQALWSTAHGRFLEASSASGVGASRLATHVDPLLALLAPLWMAWPSPLLLVSVSAVALASGALPVYWLAQKHLGSDRAAHTFALVYLLCPLTQWNAFWDFHPVSLAVPLILYAIWFLDEGRLVPFALFALLAAASKEQIPLAVGCLGIWYGWTRRRPVVGTLVFGLGLSATLADVLVVMPHFAVPGVHPLADRYAAVGGTPAGIAHTALTDPGHLMAVAFTPRHLAYLATLTVLFCGLFLLEPLLALGAAPSLSINLLSSFPHQTELTYHYTAGILPFLLAATILGAERLQRRAPRAPRLVLGVAAVAFLVLSPLPLAVSDLHAALRPDAAQAARLRAVSLVPAAARVSTGNGLGARLSERRHVSSFPYVAGADWVVLDLSDPVLVDRYEPAAFRRAVAALRRSPRWRLRYSSHGILVFHRVDALRRRRPPSGGSGA